MSNEHRRHQKTPRPNRIECRIPANVAISISFRRDTSLQSSIEAIVASRCICSKSAANLPAMVETETERTGGSNHPVVAPACFESHSSAFFVIVGFFVTTLVGIILGIIFIIIAGR
jgi:hypothetical protein